MIDQCPSPQTIEKIDLLTSLLLINSFITVRKSTSSRTSRWAWRTAKLFSRFCPIVDLRCVFSRRSALKERFAVADEIGTTWRSLITNHFWQHFFLTFLTTRIGFSFELFCLLISANMFRCSCNLSTSRSFKKKTLLTVQNLNLLCPPLTHSNTLFRPQWAATSPWTESVLWCKIALFHTPRCRELWSSPSGCWSYVVSLTWLGADCKGVQRWNIPVKYHNNFVWKLDNFLWDRQTNILWTGFQHTSHGSNGGWSLSLNACQLTAAPYSQETTGNSRESPGFTHCPGFVQLSPTHFAPDSLFYPTFSYAFSLFHILSLFNMLFKSVELTSHNKSCPAIISINCSSSEFVNFPCLNNVWKNTTYRTTQNTISLSKITSQK